MKSDRDVSLSEEDKRFLAEVKAAAEKQASRPEFQKLQAEVREQLAKTGRGDPTLVGKLLGGELVTDRTDPKILEKIRRIKTGAGFLL